MVEEVIGSDGKEFEERSDYIAGLDLINWNVKNDFFDNIQRELLGNGSRLFVGPRGTGKTHQMKLAYHTCVKQPSKPVAIFVSLNKYFHLEPLLIKAPNAIQIFHSWVLAKVMLGCYDFLKDTDIQLEEDSLIRNILTPEIDLEEFQNIAESPFSTNLESNELTQSLSISKVIAVIEFVIGLSNRNRAVIFLDDAALTLTPDYFIEFLDIFRSLKNKVITPKASVYPGTTQYSPRFHVGHDAQFVNCWMSIENERYSEFMESIIDVRFSDYKDSISKEVLELIKYASFGVPRTLIGLLHQYYTASTTDTTVQSKFNSIMEQRSGLIEAEYLSLKQKMPQYDKVIQIGWDFFKRVINALKDENRTLTDEKNYVLGILDDNNKMAIRMVNFLREAGLVYLEDSVVKHGDQREYRRYIPHILFLIQNRTFNRGRGFNPSETLANLRAKPKKHPLRRTFNTILNPQEISNLKLNLPPCQNCNTPRISEEQKFCHNCGSQLVNQSIFEQCLAMEIDSLPLSLWQKERIREIQIKTIGDFLTLSNPGGELRKVKGIGKVRSQQITAFIHDTVEETLNKTLTDFLS